jgi:hypothetical protein
MTTSTLTPRATARTTPTARVLTASLLAAPVLYLAADSLYAARGWDDAGAGVLHVIAAIAYGFVVLAVASWLPRESWLTAALVVVGLVGMAGNVAYGFDAIHTSFGDTKLVDRDGAANLIKVLGLFYPLSLLLVGVALGRLGHVPQACAVGIAAVAWPVAHIANIAELAVPLNVILTLALGSLAVGGPLPNLPPKSNRPA